MIASWLIQCNRQSDSGSHPPSLKQQFIFSIVSDIETFDPLDIIYTQEWQLASFVYEGLFGYGIQSTEIEPLLAKNVDMMNGKQIRIGLRTDVFFHDDPCFPQTSGRLLTAHDVAYTFRRIRNHTPPSPNASLLEGKIEQILVENDSTLVFTLTDTYATFLKILASPLCYIVPHEAVAYYGDTFEYHPVGTGPFQLVRREPFQSLEFIQNKHYWKKDENGNALPRLESVLVRIVNNESKNFSEFIKNTNMLLQPSGERALRDFENLPAFSVSQEIKTCTGLTLRFFGFSMDTKSPYAKNAELRTAIALGFDRQQLHLNASKAQTQLACTLVPPGLLNQPAPEWYPYNPQLASHLIKSMVSVNALQHELTLHSNIEAADIQVLRDGLNRLKIPNQLTINKTRYFNRILSERPDIFRVSFLPSYPDPQEYYSLFYSKSPPEINLTGYKNFEFDLHFDKAQVETDSLKRLNHFLQMEALLKQDLPLIYISHSKPVSFFVPPYVKHFQTRYVLFDLSEVKLEQAP